MFKLSPEAEEIRQILLQELPPVIARKHVEYFLGGLVTSKTLAKLDCLGEGPNRALNFGDCVAYRRQELVDFVLHRWPVTSRRTLEELLALQGKRVGKLGRRRPGSDLA